LTYLPRLLLSKLTSLWLIVSGFNNNDTGITDECLTTGDSFSRSTPDATSHSVTAATSPANATPDCASCRTLNDRVNKLQKQLAMKARLFAALRNRHKATLRKVRKIAREKVAFGCAVKKFLNVDQQKALCRSSQRGSKWSSATVKNALQLHFACGPTGYRVLLSQKYPLPSLRTLSRSIQFVKFESGILMEVVLYCIFAANTRKQVFDALRLFCFLVRVLMWIESAADT
jgi:Transposase protein